MLLKTNFVTPKTHPVVWPPNCRAIHHRYSLLSSRFGQSHFETLCKLGDVDDNSTLATGSGTEIRLVNSEKSEGDRTLEFNFISDCFFAAVRALHVCIVPGLRRHRAWRDRWYSLVCVFLGGRGSFEFLCGFNYKLHVYINLFVFLDIFNEKKSCRNRKFACLM